MCGYRCPVCKTVKELSEFDGIVCSSCSKSMWKHAKKRPVIVEFREVIGEREEIGTLENRGGEKLIANRGQDYVIRGTRGELYPIKKEIFAETYDIVEE
jgi:hypothetical protein